MGADILKHELVPQHELLSKKDAKDFLEKLGITPRQLPKILMADPVMKALKAKEGDIVRITRKSPTAGIAPYYRVVVDG